MQYYDPSQQYMGGYQDPYQQQFLQQQQQQMAYQQQPQYQQAPPQPQPQEQQQQYRMPLANETTAAPGGAEEEPMYVNAKQYHRILKRREARAKLEQKYNIPKERAKFLHESRHKHALNRVRGVGGKFTKKEKPAPKAAEAAKKGAAAKAGRKKKPPAKKKK